MGKKRKLEYVPVSSFRVGDIYCYGLDATREFRIIDIRSAGAGRVAFTLSWISGEPTDRPTRVIKRNLRDNRVKCVFIERDCYPCYDSDCECVYDDVPDD